MLKKKLKINLVIFIISLFYSNLILADNHNTNEILKLIQEDIKTLERAVYSDNFIVSSSSESSNLDDNSEDVLTRHLLKLSEIESQFQNLTNRFEEINFKLDKLSTRLSKVQSDNQLRFQQIEKTLNNSISNQADKLLTTNNSSEEKSLPGSSEPQDLGSVSYKDMTTESDNQETVSIDTTKSVVTEVFVAEENILPDETPEKQYKFATSFLKVGDYNTAERAFRE